MFMIKDYVRTGHDLLLTGGRDIHSVGQFISFRRQQWRRHHQPGGRGGQLLHHRGGTLPMGAYSSLWGGCGKDKDLGKFF